MESGEKTQFKWPGNGRKAQKIHPVAEIHIFTQGEVGKRGRRGRVNGEKRQLKSAKDMAERTGKAKHLGRS